MSRLYGKKIRKILVIGLPYFAENTAKRLSVFDSTCKYIPIDSSANIWGALKFAVNIWNADIVYMIGGSATCGGALRLSLLLRKHIIMHWVGTDVIEAKKNIQSGNSNKKLITYARHFCDAPWLQEELHGIGIEASLKYLSCIDNEPKIEPLPPKFLILSYVGKGRESFYGIEKLIAIAERFPQIPIEISTLETYKHNLPKNIRLLGFVPSLKEKMKECVLFLRLPEHDGFPFTIIEAMEIGRYVAYIHELPGIFKPNTKEDLFEYIEQLYAKYSIGLLEPNYSGFEYVRNNHSAAGVIGNLMQSLKVQNDDK